MIRETSQKGEMRDHGVMSLDALTDRFSPTLRGVATYKERM